MCSRVEGVAGSPIAVRRTRTPSRASVAWRWPRRATAARVRPSRRALTPAALTESASPAWTSSCVSAARPREGPCVTNAMSLEIKHKLHSSYRSLIRNKYENAVKAARTTLATVCVWRSACARLETRTPVT